MKLEIGDIIYPPNVTNDNRVAHYLIMDINWEKDKATVITLTTQNHRIFQMVPSMISEENGWRKVKK